MVDGTERLPKFKEPDAFINMIGKEVDMEKLVERRKHKRFKASDRAFVIHGPYFTNRSQIVDISKGGLAFRYIGGERLSGSFNLDILFAENSFYLGKIPVKTVSDKKADQGPFDSISMRRHGVQFGELTSHQMSQLGYFISNHTSEAEDEKKGQK